MVRLWRVLTTLAIKSKTNSATRCSGLLKQLTCGSNVLGLMMALDILTPLEQLNRSLQSTSATVSGMLQAIEQTLSDLRDLRTDSAFDALLNKAMKLIEELELDHTSNCHGLVVHLPV